MIRILECKIHKQYLQLRGPTIKGELECDTPMDLLDTIAEISVQVPGSPCQYKGQIVIGPKQVINGRTRYGFGGDGEFVNV